MTLQRFALGVLAIVAGLAALYLATSDVHYTDRNCGTAIFATDVNKFSVETGDVEQDDFAEQSVITNCKQLILGRRFLTALPAVICIASIVAGQRLRDRPERLSGPF